MKDCMKSNRIAQIKDAVSKATSTYDKVHEVLRLGVLYFNEDIGIISRIEDDVYTVSYVHPTDGTILEGAEYRLEETFCAITYEADRALGINDVRKSRWKTHPCTRTGLLSYIGSPIILRGTRIGTINFSSVKTSKETVDGELELICEMAQIVTRIFEYAQP